jgi:dolichol-phosphate mannosyltransferase
MPTESPSVWICLPTYNERENLERMVRALGEEFAAHAIDGTVLVIDDGSPDGTGAIADELADELPWVRVLHRTEKAGLGKAYIAGFGVALDGGADLVMEMDCDFSHDPRDVHRLVAAATLGDADVVLGSRNVPEGGVRNWPLSRRIISKGGSWYARSILGLPVRDLTGGFKCFRREVLELLDLGQIAAAGYIFQIEVTYRAVQAGFRVREVPIVFTDRVYGESKMTGSIVREAMWRVWGLRFTRPRPLRDGSPGKGGAADGHARAA